MRRITRYLAVFLFVPPATAATPLPVRKAGHWQLTTVAETVGMKTFDTCIAPADPVITGAGDGNCEQSDVKLLGNERYVDVVCRTHAGKETTSTVLTGDFTTWYRAMSKITFDPPQNGISHMGVTIDGKYLGPDCTPSKNPRN